MKNEKLKVELNPKFIRLVYDSIRRATIGLSPKKISDVDYFCEYVCNLVQDVYKEIQEESIETRVRKCSESNSFGKENDNTNHDNSIETTLSIAKRTASCLWITVICVMVGLGLCANSGILTVFFILMSVMVALIGAVLGPKWLRNEWTKVFEVEA